MSTLAHSFLNDFDDDEDLPVAKPIPAPVAAASKAAAQQQRLPRVKQEHKDDADDDDEEEEGDADLIVKGGKRAAAMPGEGDDAEMDAIDEDDEDEGEGGEGAEADEPEDEATAAAAAAAAAASAAPVFSNATPIAALSALLHSERLQSHMAIIAHFQFGTPIPPLGTASATAAANAAAASSGNATAASAAAATHTPPPLNREREYPYIVSSNELSFEIDGVIQSLHKYARDLYAPRYAELEQLLSNPVDYARVASAIANETDMTRITKILQGAAVAGIPNNVLLTISVTATTTRGKPLESSELDKLQLVCNTIQELDKIKTRIHSYIASRMSVLAPNISAMLGTDVAARLVALAGGIKKLGEMPACNIQNLGKKGKNASGLSRISQGIHDGLIVTTKIIQDTPPSMRQRALRLLAGKVALAARLDSFSDDAAAPTSAGSATIVDSRAGEDFLADIVAKIEKWQEAPAARMTKALPVPLSRAKSKRGGKRYRKEKERMAITDIRKQKNRTHFGKEERVDEYTGEGMGMLGSSGSGVLKVVQKDAKLAKRLSQKTQARLKRTGGHTAGPAAAFGTVTSLSNISGTASSIAFTPMQGMQLVKTESAALKAMQRANDNYFSNAGAFVKVKNEAAAAAAAAAGGAAAPKKHLPPVPIFSQASSSAASVGSELPDSKRARLA